MKFLIIGDNLFVVPLDKVIIKRDASSKFLRICLIDNPAVVLHSVESSSANSADILDLIRVTLANTITIN